MLFRSAAGGPVDLYYVPDAVEVTSGTAHTCARRGDGVVVCWGTGAGGSGAGGLGGPALLPVVVNPE